MKRLFFGLVAMVVVLFARADGVAVRRDAAAIIKRTVERARELAEDPNEKVYRYDKRTMVESLNGKGEVAKRKFKRYEVTMKGGVPDSRLVAIEGRSLSPKQIAKEDEKLKRRKRSFMKSDKGGKELTPRTFVPEDLTHRYDVTYLREEKVDGRSMHVVSYTPKQSSPPARNLVERVANELSGTMWIDVEDCELARIEVRLVERVKLWGGFLGALDEFTYSLERARSPESVWYNDVANVGVNARGLFKRLRFRMVEKTSNFRRATAPLPDE